MVTKSREKVGKKQAKAKVGKLKLNKETVKQLTGNEQKQVKGGSGGPCRTYTVGCALKSGAC